MSSKKSINLIIFISLFFILHILLYYFVPSYSNFFKSLKYDNLNLSDDKEQNWIDSSGVVDLVWVSSYTWSKFIIPDINWFTWVENDLNIEQKNLNIETWTIVEGSISTGVLVKSRIEKQNKETNETDLTSAKDVENELIELFISYWLKEKEITKVSTLFWITNEYPYKYKEYASSDNKITLYIFDEDRTYDDILNIFDVISYNMYFKIKKINNFWDSSFYINLDWEYDDNYTRFVFSYKNRIFWLKIKKDIYNEIKWLLLNIW